jgi:TolB protein
VLGEIDIIELACLWTDEVGTGALWHQVLNIGVPLAASSGSDVMNDYYRTMAIGATRVYARVEGTLTSDSFLQAVKAGKSFNSNGPLLQFEVAACIQRCPMSAWRSLLTVRLSRHWKAALRLAARPTLESCRYPRAGG